MSAKTFLTKLTQWEYWPAYMFYLPLVPYYIVKAIQARNPIFYLATNPAFKYSGNGTESKYKTVLLIPEKYRPKTVLIKSGQDIVSTKNQILNASIEFPLIAKPDIGFRGFLVQKIDSLVALENYLNKNDIDIIIQEFIGYKNECGIFYSRIPNQNSGKVTSLTLKKFLTITGDGISTLSELVLKDQRASIYYNYLVSIHKKHMNSVLEKGQDKIVSVIGNHARGTQFINGNHLIDSQLEYMMDTLNKQIKGWYYGRIDIKYDTLEKVKQGVNFKILEINGIISEPTHIYDPTTGASYLDAIKSMRKHWSIMNKIARNNHAEFKITYPKFMPYFKDVLWLRTYAKKLKRLNK
jgi:hypothetical protein